jgi:hypothetical protein
MQIYHVCVEGGGVVNICICTLLFHFSAITIYGSNCSQDNQYVMYLKSKQKGNFNLTRANFTKLPDLHECQLKVKFDKKYSYFTMCKYKY